MTITNDPISDKAKQEAMDSIREGIIQMVEASQDGDVIDERVYKVSLAEIDKYLRILARGQNLPFKLPRVRSVPVRDPQQFEALCEYNKIKDVDFPKANIQKIYFFETCNFAVTIIPIELEPGVVNIHMEPLDASPDWIRTMFEDLDKPKSIEDIPFVKLQ